MNEKKNRLWAAATTDAAMEEAKRFPHSYACDDHCLIISQEKPDGFLEVGESLGALLDASDWRWILGESEKIRQEQLSAYQKKLADEQERFIERFIRALEDERGEAERHEQEKQENGAHGKAER